MNTPSTDHAARESVRPNDTIQIVGRVGRHQVELEIRGVRLRDLLAGAVALGLLLGDDARVETRKQREQLGHKAYEIAEAMIRSRRAR